MPGAELSIPAAQTFLEQSEAKALLQASKVIGSVEQGDGDAQPTMVPKRDHGREARQRQSESEGFSLTMTHVSVVQGSRGYRKQHLVPLPS